jgi:exonuclease SbcD
VKGASLADLHLGFRQFSHTTNSRNTREIDVERAWYAAVEQIIAARPDIVTIAGDIFHHPRVSDFAKKAFLDGVRRLLAAGIIVIVLQGNHDAGRTAEVLTPIMLADGADNLYIVTKPERVMLTVCHDVQHVDGSYEELSRSNVSVACFPFVARAEPQTYRLDPDPTADLNILLMHAAVKSEVGDDLPRFYGSDQALDVGTEAERWDVIACGDFHEYRRLHPTRLAFYSGALERTSSNIWQEEAPKGWVLWDTEAGTMELREVPTRKMYDLVGEGQASAEWVNRLLQSISEMEPVTDAIVRLKVDDFPMAERDHIAWDLVRQLQGVCAHFYLDVRYRQHEEQALGDRRERGMSLAEEAVRFFADDPAEVRAMALSYLEVQADVEDIGEDL